jgi:hypothetical protein
MGPGMPLEQRFTLHPQQNQFFVNFEGHVVIQPSMLQASTYFLLT